MKIIISTKNISLDKPLETFVEDKIGGLEKFIKDPNNLVEVRVEIGKPSKHHRSGPIYYAEVNMKIGSKLLRATCEHEDLRNAVTDVKDELQRQIKKLKGKRG
jgi:ribosomal subunit interface protein